MGKKISTTEVKVTSAVGELTRQEMGIRCGTFLRERYEWPRTKTIARDLDIAPATAKELLANKPPSGEVIRKLTNRFGAPFVLHLWAPAIGWNNEAAFLADLDELQRSAAALRKRITAANVLPASSPGRGSSDPTSSRREASLNLGRDASVRIGDSRPPFSDTD